MARPARLVCGLRLNSRKRHASWPEAFGAHGRDSPIGARCFARIPAPGAGCTKPLPRPRGAPADKGQVRAGYPVRAVKYRGTPRDWGPVIRPLIPYRRQAARRPRAVSVPPGLIAYLAPVIGPPPVARTGFCRAASGALSAGYCFSEDVGHAVRRSSCAAAACRAPCGAGRIGPCCYLHPL